MRVDEAIKAGESLIPVRYISCTEESEKMILQYFDSIGDLATVDKDALSSLVEYNKKTMGKLKNAKDKALAQLSKDQLSIETGPLIPRTPNIYKSKEKAPKLDPETMGFTPHPDDADVEGSYINNEVKFPSSNEFDLPDLLSHELATEYPTITYNRKEESITPDTYYCHSVRPFPLDRVGGFTGFYTEDRRFEAAYTMGDTFAEMLRGEGWRGIILPDFSTYTSWPFPLQLFNVYRSRWCGRLWQELGMKVIPTVQYLGERTRSVILKTLPSRVPVVAMQTRKYSGTETHDFEVLINLIKLTYTTLKFDTMILYGNPIIKRYIEGYLPRGPRYVYLTEFNTARRKGTQ